MEAHPFSTLLSSPCTGEEDRFLFLNWEGTSDLIFTEDDDNEEEEEPALVPAPAPIPIPMPAPKGTTPAARLCW